MQLGMGLVQLLVFGQRDTSFVLWPSKMKLLNANQLRESCIRNKKFNATIHLIRNALIRRERGYAVVVVVVEAGAKGSRKWP